MQYLTILGSTGSIGVSTLDVVARNPQRFVVTALAALMRCKLRGTSYWHRCVSIRRQNAVKTVRDQTVAGAFVGLLCILAASKPVPCCCLELDVAFPRLLLL